MFERLSVFWDRSIAIVIIAVLFIVVGSFLQNGPFPRGAGGRVDQKALTSERLINQDSDSKEQVSDTSFEGSDEVNNPLAKESSDDRVLSTVAQQRPDVSQTSPAIDPEPVQVQPPKPAFIAPGASSYTPRALSAPYTSGVGQFPHADAVTESILGRLGYSQSSLYAAGILVRGHDNLVQKACGGASGRLAVYGIAVKPHAVYENCGEAGPIIPESYKTPGKCTVHYTKSTASYGSSATGNATAVLAHEIAHCLDFIYGEPFGLSAAYTSIRPAAIGSLTQTREVFADDFMICKHGVDTSWGLGSYHNIYGASSPSDEYCQQFNQLIDSYFPF